MDEIKVTGDELNVYIYKFLDRIANTTGETITEYHWREACELMKLMEDNNMIQVNYPNN